MTRAVFPAYSADRAGNRSHDNATVGDKLAHELNKDMLNSQDSRPIKRSNALAPKSDGTKRALKKLRHIKADRRSTRLDVRLAVKEFRASCRRDETAHKVSFADDIERLLYQENVHEAFKRIREVTQPRAVSKCVPLAKLKQRFYFFSELLMRDSKARQIDPMHLPHQPQQLDATTGDHWVVFSDGSYYESGKNKKYKNGSTGFGMWAMNKSTGQEILLAGAGEKNAAKSSTYTEALAILAATIELAGCDLTIYTDSQCCIDTFRNLPDLAQGNAGMRMSGGRFTGIYGRRVFYSGRSRATLVSGRTKLRTAVLNLGILSQQISSTPKT